MGQRARYATGWIRDLPSVTDYRPRTETVPARAKAAGEKEPVARMLQELNLQGAAEIDSTVDLSDGDSPIEDQGDIGSCTAQAAAGLIEYLQRRATGEHLDVSRLFIYKVTRNLLGWTGDTGAYLRSTMGAITLFGAPPERYLPYDTASYEDEPSAFHYAFASNYQALAYYRLDEAGVAPEVTLGELKKHIAAGIPAMFGFAVYDSLRDAEQGRIPYPVEGDKQAGGHAVVAIGYDDGMVIGHPSGKDETTGALKIRNSWGTGWGEDGYGYLPYEYVLTQQAVDFWTLLKSEWVETGHFGLNASGT